MLPRLLHRLQAARRLPPQVLLILAVSAAALASGLYGMLRGPAASPPALSLAPDPPDPDALLSRPVETAYEAARRGDLSRYLDQFTDPLLAQLSATRADKGDPYLRDYLDRQTAPLKGLAADLTRKKALDPDAVRLPVEFVYADRNEVQWFVLRRAGDRWRISRIESVRSAPTLIPYGTPVQSLR